MIVEWQTASAAERARVEPRVALLETAQQAEPARRELVRLTLAQEVLAELRARPGHAAAPLPPDPARGHPSPHRPGQSTRDREMTDALANLMGFVLFEAAGVAQSPCPRV